VAGEGYNLISFLHHRKRLLKNMVYALSWCCLQ